MNNESIDFSLHYKINSFKLSLIGLIQLAVGMVTVVIGSFVNAEMSLQGWKTSDISIFLGVGVYFEVIRIYFGRLSDRNNKVKPFIIFGLILSLIGLILIPLLILPIGNPLLILAITFFAIGTAIISTLIDSHVTAISQEEERNKVAGFIQGFRLTGYAIGGILGFLFFSRLNFVQFIGLMTGLYILLAGISLLQISDKDRLIQTNSSVSSIWKLDMDFLKQPTTIMMIFFLLLYPLGLFMQDNILEPFAINALEFDKGGVGRLSAIWGMVTLIFVPLGISLSNKFGRIPISIIGQVSASIGLITMAISGYLQSEPLFYFGLFLFGSGSGLYSVPGIATMFDVAAKSPNYLATNLAIFGIIVTISRGNAGLISGLILRLTGENYYTVFMIEAVIAIGSLVPYLFVERRLSK